MYMNVGNLLICPHVDDERFGEVAINLVTAASYRI